MIVAHTAPHMAYDTKTFDFSDEEKQRVKEILDELRDIFMAESVSLEIPASVSSKVNCTININGAPNPGFQFK